MFLKKCQSIICAAGLLLSAVCQANPEAKPQADWFSAISDAIAAKPDSQLPLLLFFWTPEARWDTRMRRILTDAEQLTELLNGFIPVSLKMPANQQVADAYGIRKTPALVVVSPSGKIIAARAGFLDTAGCREFLLQALGPVGQAIAVDELSHALTTLARGDEDIPDTGWIQLFVGMGNPAFRQEIRKRLLLLEKFPAAQCVNHLTHPRLSVRLGALELLEEKAGHSFGFDPWLPSSAGSVLAHSRWEAWSENPGDSDEEPLYAAISLKDVSQCLEDLSSTDWGRAARARRSLFSGGDGTVAAVGAYLEKHPELSPGLVQLLREVQFAACLQKAPAVDGERLARQLAFGDLDARLAAIPELEKARLAAVPILRDLLTSSDPLIREAVADSLGEIGGNTAVEVLGDHLQNEKDVDVIVTIATRLGKTKTKRSMLTLNHLLRRDDEEIRVAALEALSNFESSLEISDDILACLDDTSWRVRATAVACLGNSGLKQVVGHIVPYLSDEDAFVRSSAVAALAKMDVEKHAKTLEKTYLHQPDLRPLIMPLLAKNGDLSNDILASLPRESGESLQRMLAILEAEAGDYAFRSPSVQGKRIRAAQERIAEAALISADIDLKAVAYASYAHMAGLSSMARGRTIEALASPERRVRLETLRSLKMPLIPSVLSQALGAASVTEDVRGEQSPDNEQLDELMGLFGAPSEKKPAAAEPRREEKRKDEGNPVDNLAAAFGLGTDDVPATGGPVKTEASPGGAPEADVTDLYHALMDAHSKAADSEERALAAFQIVQAGNPDGLTDLVDGRAHLSERQNDLLINRLFALNTFSGADTIARDLVFGTDQQARREFCARLISEGGPDKWIDLVFTELRKPGGPVTLKDFQSYSLRSLAEDSGRLTRFRPHAIQLAAPGHGSVGTQALAIYLLLGSKDPEAIKLAGNYLDSDEAGLRALAWIFSGLADTDVFLQRLPRVINDADVSIRRMLPLIITGGELRLENGDDLTLSLSDDLIKKIRRKLLFSDAGLLTKHLNTLATDKDPRIRIQSLLALGLLGESVDTNALRGAVAAVAKDAEQLIERTLAYEYRKLFRRKAPETARLLGEMFPDISYFGKSSDLYGDDELNEERPAPLPPSLADMSGKYQFRDSQDNKTPETNPNQDTLSIDTTPETTAPSPETERQSVKILVFYKPGCGDCRQLAKMLKSLERGKVILEIERWNINTPEGIQLNRVLCDRFGVSARQRGIAPAVFTSAGALAHGDITDSALRNLITAAAEGPVKKGWSVATTGEERQAEQAIRDDFDHITFGFVLMNGLVDGINPCAFAALIFLLSYLSVTRKTTRAILAVGGAYTLAVFITYLCLGLGLTGVAESLTSNPVGARIVRGILMILLAALAIFSLRDAVLCWRGGAEKMTLRLPPFLTRIVHARIRQGVKARYIVPAAFITGVIVSLLELACTGQVYLPTILFVLRSSATSQSAFPWLLVYNLAFVVPLLIIFGLYAGGLRSQTLSAWFNRHAVLAKLLLTTIFLAMLILLVVGG
ncbi:MAG: HEAT repeat domain-containing protein [Lentisphaeria bacterium]|nr:HEAT repeat domain-containing protein [Lentisphaeria bacterium]